MPTDRLRSVIAEQVLQRHLPQDAQGIAGDLATAAGPAVLAVLFFGSRKTLAGPDANSAYDLFVVVDDYSRFYLALAAAGWPGRPARLLTALNRVLAPNQVAFHSNQRGGEPLHAKCAVISLAHLQRETSRARHDHFCLGRLFQPVELLYVADEGVRDAVLSLLTSAHRLTFSWVRPWLPTGFDAASYARALLRTSFAAEIRPEPVERTEALYHAQAAYLEPVYGQLLRELEAAGELKGSAEAGYSLVRSVSRGEWLALTLYFKRSLARATLRWAKHMVTFDGWLDFIVSKAERHSGQRIELTRRERRYPVVFLWPRFWRFWRHKNR